MLPGEFRHGNKSVRAKSLRGPRGLAQGWIASGQFWRSMCQAIDVMIAYTYDDSLRAMCANIETRMGFWSAIILTRKIESAFHVWRRLFGSPTDRLVSMDIQLSGRNPAYNIIWTTWDAAPGIISAVNWATRSFIRIDPEELLDSFGRSQRHRYMISECELGSLDVQVASWGSPSGSRQLTLSGTDNPNALSWIDRGEAEAGIALEITASIFLRRITRDIEMCHFQ